MLLLLLLLLLLLISVFYSGFCRVMQSWKPGHLKYCGYTWSRFLQELCPCCSPISSIKMWMTLKDLMLMVVIDWPYPLVTCHLICEGEMTFRFWCHYPQVPGCCSLVILQLIVYRITYKPSSSLLHTGFWLFNGNSPHDTGNKVYAAGLCLSICQSHCVKLLNSRSQFSDAKGFREVTFQGVIECRLVE